MDHRKYAQHTVKIAIFANINSHMPATLCVIGHNMPLDIRVIADIIKQVLALESKNDFLRGVTVILFAICHFALIFSVSRSGGAVALV